MNIVFEQLQNLISNRTSVAKDQITLQSQLTEDFGLDSLSFIELIVDVEQEFEISIAHSEVEAIQTVEELVGYIRSQFAT
jgi:acyl carrier protein